MALIPFAKGSELKILAPAMSEEKADLLLDLVSGAIRTSLHWDVDKVTGAVHKQTIRRGQRLDAIVLPVLNLTAVSQVKVDGTTVTSAMWEATEAGVVYLKGTVAFESIEVTYTAGYQRAPVDEAPGVLRQVALDYALRWGSNPGGVRTYQIGGTAETFSGEIAAAADEDHRLDPLRVEA